MFTPSLLDLVKSSATTPPVWSARRCAVEAVTGTLHGSAQIPKQQSASQGCSDFFLSPEISHAAGIANGL